VQHFARRMSEEHNLRPRRFDPGALELLQRARWRGNIRELRNTVERLLIMSPGDVIRAEDLPADLRGEAGRTSADVPAPPVVAAGTLREFKDRAERDFLVQRLRENGWNISKTAEVIDTPRSNLYKKLEQYGIRQENDG
jgi:two-component system, NtrC family, nitrogen regulation response regulator NtrX